MTTRLSDFGVSTTGNVTADGNVITGGIKTNNYMYANGSPVTFEDGYGNANVQALLNSGAFTGDFIPNGNATQSLGSNTNQWLDLWVSNATIYLNSIPLGVSGNGVLQFDGNDIVTSGPNVINTGNVETTGNVVGGNLVITAGGGVTFADGTVQTSAYGNANVAAYLPTYSGNLGNITATGDVVLAGSPDANITATTNNLNISASNYVIIDSLNNGQIEIGTSDVNVGVVVLGSATKNVVVRSELAEFDGNITANYVIADGSSLTNLDLNSSIIAINSNVANTNSEVSNVSNAVITLSQATTDAFANTNANLANTNSNVATVASDLSNTNSNLGNLTITVSDQANAIGNLQAGSYSNANVDAYLPIYTGNISSNIITANVLAGEGGNISNITGANVTGEVALANTVTNPSQPNITALGTITSLNAGAITGNTMTMAGNVQFDGNVYFAANVTIPGNIIQISGNSGNFYGDPATGFGALYAGIPAGFTPLINEVVQTAGNDNSYVQTTMRNLNSGSQATGDFVITADNGSDTTNHIDMGIASSSYNGALANNSLGTSLYPNDGYLYTKGNVLGGNLVLGSNQANGVVRIIANGASNIGEVVATFGATGLEIGDITAKSGSPAPTISGFSFTGLSANITGNVTGGNVLAAGVVSATGNVTGAYFLGNGSQLTGLDSSPAISSINANIANTNGNVANLTTALGNTDSNVANLVTVTTNTDSNVANLTTALSNTDSNVANNTSDITTLQGQVYGNANVAANLAAFGSNPVSTTGNVTGGNIRTTGLVSATGNVTAGNVNTAIVSATGTVQAGNLRTAGLVSATGNVTGGNVITTGRVSATGNVYGGNVFAIAPAGASFNVGDCFSNGTIVTLDYIGIGQASFPVGSTITITDGVEVPGLDGTYVVTAASADQCSFLNNTVASTGNVPTGFSNTFPTVTGVNSAVISTSGNVVAGRYVLGDGSLLTNLPVQPGTYTNSNVATFLSAFGSNTISTTGNITGSYIIGNGSQLTGLPAGYTDANVVTLLSSFGSNAISTTGNITAGYLYGDGSNLTGLPAGYSDSNVVTLMASFGSNTISTTGNVTSGNFVTTGTAGTGNISGVNYITANYLIGDGSMLTNLPTNAPVIESVTSGATITPAAADTQYNVTALAEAAAFAAPSGTPLDGQKLTIRIIDDGTPRALTWDPIYTVIGTTLPTTTVANKYVYIGCIYNGQETTWDVVSVAQQA